MLQPTRRFLSLAIFLVLGLLLLPRLSSAQVTSSDPNFTPSVLKAGLSGPTGLFFRPPTGDLVVSQNGANLISLVDARSGATKTFTTQSLAYEVAVRASDGLVAVTTKPDGPIDFYDSTGNFVNSIAAGIPNTCLGGLVFDASGNLSVAAGPLTEGGCSSTGWNIYEFPGPNPWATTEPSSILDGSINQIEGLAFSAAPPPPFGVGTLYAVSPTSGNVYEISLTQDCPTCSISGNPRTIATVTTTFDISGNPVPGIWGIAIDSLSGDIYISESNGPDVLTMSPPCTSCDPAPTQFATGFSNTLGLGFDIDGNLYVNETHAGNTWKFTRNSFATPQQTITPGQTQTFTNPNKAMSDQIQTIFIPPSANLCDSNGNCAVFLRDIFVPVLGTKLDARLAPGSSGDSDFFGGGPVPPNSSCVLVPSASPNSASPTYCLVTIQQCFDKNHHPFFICPVQEPSSGPGSSDLIQLKSEFTDSNPPDPNTRFVIDFDAPPNNNTLTDITTAVFTDNGGGGGSKGLCSLTTLVVAPANSGDFTLGPISPITVASGGSSAPTTVPITTQSFSQPINLGVSDAPTGVTPLLNQLSVTPAANTTNISTTLSVMVGSTLDSATTTSGIATVIANLVANGCIDNGVANALNSKLSAAQADIGGGQIKTALNVLGAFKSQVQAEAGKHISTSCTTTFTLIVTGNSFGEVHSALVSVNVTGTNAASILINDVSSVISFLGTSPDPITGFVFQGGLPVVGAIVSLSPLPAVTTDLTGFYYFPGTSSLTKGATYTIQVGSLSQTFTWMGKGSAINFALP